MCKQHNISTIKRKILVPRYMRDFSCIGSECEDTCCVGWRVHVDKRTYKKYKKVQNRELEFLLDKRVKRIRSNSTFYAYAQIEMEKNRSCPFLSEKNYVISN